MAVCLFYATERAFQYIENYHTLKVYAWLHANDYAVRNRFEN